MENDSALDTLCEIMETERAFFAIVRFLDARTRNSIVSQHMRNIHNAMALIRESIVSRRAQTATTHGDRIVMNIPLNMLMDPSGIVFNQPIPPNFMEPVPIIPTPAQIDAAVERHVRADTICAICQEHTNCATRIHACGHLFHGPCLQEWFTMNARCPMCRHDIRDLPNHIQRPDADRDREDDDGENNRVHADEEQGMDL